MKIAFKSFVKKSKGLDAINWKIINHYYKPMGRSKVHFIACRRNRLHFKDFLRHKIDEFKRIAVWFTP